MSDCPLMVGKAKAFTPSKTLQAENFRVVFPPKKAAAPKAQDDLSGKTVAELKELAKAKGITGISSMKKADLIAALQA